MPEAKPKLITWSMQFSKPAYRKLQAAIANQNADTGSDLTLADVVRNGLAVAYPNLADQIKHNPNTTKGAI